MSFKSMIDRDIRNVFMNFSEFAERRDLRYDGEEYENVPVMIQNTRERGRLEHSKAYQDDTAHGYYLRRIILFAAKESLCGKQPEQGMHFFIKEHSHSGGWWRRYTVAQSTETEGLLKIQLEAVDE